jgi:hypothetical protein
LCTGTIIYVGFKAAVNDPTQAQINIKKEEILRHKTT